MRERLLRSLLNNHRGAHGVHSLEEIRHIVESSKEHSTVSAFEAHATSLYPSFETSKKTLETGDESARDSATSLQAQISSSQTIAFVSLGIGIVAAVASAALWVIGDDPGRYARYKDLKVVLTPAPGGGFTLISW